MITLWHFQEGPHVPQSMLPCEMSSMIRASPRTQVLEAPAKKPSQILKHNSNFNERKETACMLYRVVLGLAKKGVLFWRRNIDHMHKVNILIKKCAE